jgi:hypothetical protein
VIRSCSTVLVGVRLTSGLVVAYELKRYDPRA